MNRKLFLAAGSQSGGTTLVSWHFLQHPELDGELDMATDKVRTDFRAVKTDNIWVKMTVGCFRWMEVAELYRAYKYEVMPLLIVRNPFVSYASLKVKWYGLNSTTAEDPPLLLRFLRFYQDWVYFRQRGYPILEFEKFLADPGATLRRACIPLGIEYHDDMISAPKLISDIAYVGRPNTTFKNALDNGEVTLNNRKGENFLTSREHDWICSNMDDYLTEYGYIAEGISTDEGGLIPEPFDSRRNLGFGPQPVFKPISRFINEIVSFLESNSVQRIYIYGAGEIGLYIARCLLSAGYKVAGIFDRDQSLTLPTDLQCELSAVSSANFTSQDLVIISVLQDCERVTRLLQQVKPIPYIRSPKLQR